MTDEPKPVTGAWVTVEDTAAPEWKPWATLTVHRFEPSDVQFEEPTDDDDTDDE